MKKYQIGIIGSGDFTNVMVEFLSPYADILVSSRSKDSGEAGFGAQFAPLSEVLARPIIIPSIPAQFFEQFFTENSHLINPEALVVDVCSVKVRPLKVLQRLLPKTCQILGTHPMFGPASIAKNGGIEGLKCVVSPVRLDSQTLGKIRSLLGDDIKLKLIDKTPEEHDEEMAYVQGLSHYIGRVMQAMDIPNSKLSTLAYDDLVDMKNIQGNDSWDLFVSIMKENPYATEINDQFKEACRLIDEKIR